MLSTPKNIQTLAAKWLNGTITSQEQKVLDEWYEQCVPEKLDWTSEDEHDQVLKAKMFSAIKEDLQFDKRKVINIRRQPHIWAMVAASVLLFSISAIYVFKSTTTQHSTIVAKHVISDRLPDSNKAVLTLGDGSTIVLDNSNNGTVSKQGSTLVDKVRDGQLVYRSKSASASQSKSLNTLTTPHGGQYQLQLPDGSRVWLNAASSLKFPVAFGGQERKVELIGEAYFEIAKDAHKPFIVALHQGALIEVLGTHFNVMAYENERNINTTLLEGSVKVSSKRHTLTIKPGEQAVINETLKVYEVDAEQEIAWKKGDFQFGNTDFSGILRQLERWYDVEFIYEKLPSKKLNGIISRKYSLSQVLKMIEITSGVKFKVEGRLVKVLN